MPKTKTSPVKTRTAALAGASPAKVKARGKVPDPAERGDDTAQHAVKTLGKALNLLEAVATFPHPPTVSELALGIGVSRPTAYRLVQTLVAADFLQQDPNDARLTIGLAVLPLASSLLDRNRLRLGAMPHLQALAQKMNARVNLGILYRQQVLLLAGAEKPNLPTIYSRFGRAIPLHASGLGKAILAWLPPERATALLEANQMTARTPNTITTMAAMRRELAAIRARGFATENAESTPTSSCIAAAILDANGFPVGAVSASGRSLEAIMGEAAQVVGAAELISHLL